MKREWLKELKKQVKRRAPGWLLALLLSALLLLHPKRSKDLVLPVGRETYIVKCGKDKALVLPVGRETYIVKCGKELFFTRSPYHWHDGIKEEMLKKYTLPGFLEVHQGYTVVDVGAFIGGFSMAVASKAKKIVAIEPDPQNFRVLEMNVRFHKLRNVLLINKALWNKTCRMKLHLSSDPTSSSLLKTQDQDLNIYKEIEAIRLDELASLLGIGEIDFLKMDVEGAEIEVLEGADLRKIKRVAIDCTPERFGRSPINQVKRILEEAGFDIRVVGYMIYAKSVRRNNGGRPS